MSKGKSSQEWVKTFRKALNKLVLLAGQFLMIAIVFGYKLGKEAISELSTSLTHGQKMIGSIFASSSIIPNIIFL